MNASRCKPGAPSTSVHKLSLNKSATPRSSVIPSSSRFVRTNFSKSEGGFDEGDSKPTASKLERNMKDSDRTARRTHYRWIDWVKHRSMGRYVRHILSIPASGVFQALFRPTLFFILWSALVGVYFTAQATGAFFTGPFWPVFNFGVVPFSLTGSALSFLLVFRTNTSYRRWLEARRMFGSINTRARDLYRQALSCVQCGELRAAISRWLIAYFWSTKCFVRLGERDDLVERLEKVLEADELERLQKSPSNLRPHFCLIVISRIIQQASLQPSLVSMMDDNLSALYDAVGSCERILGTPLPLAYTRHTSRFLIMWLFLLPLGLFHAIGWWAVGVQAFISFLLLGVDEIGVSIEEPYSILSLESFGTALEKGLHEFEKQFNNNGGSVTEPMFDFELRSRQKLQTPATV